MPSSILKSLLVKTGLAVSVLLASDAAFAQQQVQLAAGPATAALPDGSVVPMWGYSCNGLTGTALAGGSPTCAALNRAANTTTANVTSSTIWSPVVITVPSGQTLQISLTNNLAFTPPTPANATTNYVPTSLVIVGQLGGGLGTSATSTQSPDHSATQVNNTWPIAGTPLNAGSPPSQGPRVQSFSTEVAAAGSTASNTQVASGTTLTWSNLRPGTYLLESGTHPSIQGPMGLYGIVVVTTPPDPTSGSPGTAYGTGPTAVSYNADVAMLFSEIDPVQNEAVSAAVSTNNFLETNVWSGQPGGCGNPLNADGSTNTSYNTCYPPAVNYTPMYYLINGVAFDKTNASNSVFAAAAGIDPVSGQPVTTGITGSVLVRLVNAGLHMHVPSILDSQAPSGAPGFSLIAEDGNPLPGLARVQSEVFMAAGKTYDVMVSAPPACTPVPPATTCTTPALPIYDRELSLSGNATARDAGMLAYIGVNGGALPTTPALASAQAYPDLYNSVIAGQVLTVSDPAKGVIANDFNVYGVKVVTPPTQGTLTLNANGTFTYQASSGFTAPDTFTYCGNGATAGPACTQVTLGAAPIEGASGISCTAPVQPFTSNVTTRIVVTPPGLLATCTDAAGYPLTVVPGSVTATGGVTVTADPSGGFTATGTAGTSATLTFQVKNSQGTVGPTSGPGFTATLQFPAAPTNPLAVTVKDGAGVPITDYRWIIEEDRTFYVNPNTTTNSGGTSIVPTFGTNFHTSYMPVVAAGCTDTLSCENGQTLLGVAAVCDVGDGSCRTTAAQQTPVLPSQVVLDPTKRYYISVLPGDAATPFQNGYLGPPDCSAQGVANGMCGHGMGGAPIAAGQTAVTILSQATPLPPAKLSVFVFEDDFPLNGEQDAGGGIDVLSPNEPGLGGFNITLFDDAGGTGDSTGQMTYDMFNQPLSNSLAGTIDPATGLDACPVSKNSRSATDKTSTGITGTIVTCPKYEADGRTLSPLAGQAVVANMMPGRYGVVATPAADRIARGEEWLQTNTLDGQKAHDSFLRIGEPAYFQEFGPAGYHVSIGFANPKIINSRLAGVCNGTNLDIHAGNCVNSLTGIVTTERMSRTPDERLYGSGDNTSFSFTQCYVSFGDPDGMDFAFTKCNSDGTFSFTGLPDGDWRITVFDQWNDMLVDGLSTPVRLGSATSFCPGTGSSQNACNMGEIAMNQWQANIYTTTFLDLNGNGVRDSNEPGLPLVITNNRFRDGSYSNFNNTDLSGNAGFNEIFPLFSWYVIETDTTRYKSTGTHVVYDAGGPADKNPICGASGAPPCGSSIIAGNLANTYEAIPLPNNLRLPGSWYCTTADCLDAPTLPTKSYTSGSGSPAWGGNGGSTGRVDAPWAQTEGWQGFSGQNQFIEFGKKPFASNETGGIHGEVIYASTRPFDDPGLLIHTSWTPDIPGVTINLYKEGTAADGTTSLTLIDTTKTSSFDDWAQGFHTGPPPTGGQVPNMNCPGQGRDTGTNADLFFFTLYNQPDWLNLYNSQHGGPAAIALPNNSQFKCYDGMHNWNQVQPAPFDGMYQFPSVTSIDPLTGVPTGTNCAACVTNPDSTDPYRYGGSTTPQPYVSGQSKGMPMLPPGKYVVEVVTPPGYELVKEEDKNILIGDNYIAPATVEFPNLAGSVFILPDQAEVGALYNANNPQNPTQTLGRTSLPSHEGDTGSVETFWPCVGAERVVPDYISLFPQSGEVAPFAGATRRLCDRKEVTLNAQESALAKFWLFSSTHVAAHFTGIITDDLTSEFDPFSPQFGEKFSPPDMPVSIKDWTGTEISRVYADHWGAYNGLTYSTWEVNPPNPTGYAPTMMVTCMNDPGSGPTPDPLYNPAYSQFCYEIPFMPGQTQYMDTPVVATSAFAGAGYNNPDCAYPDAVPGVKEVDGDAVNNDSYGPWVSQAGHTLRITAIGDQTVTNYAYSGPGATTSPFNQKTVTRHYGFGSIKGTVSVGGVNVPAASITTWTDSSITLTVPSGVPACTVQQQAQYRNRGLTAPATYPNAQCGELVITTAAGKQSVDTVTVTIGGRPPTHVAPTGSIQTAIDAAAPGDLLIVDPGVHNEMLLMWKPLRLQGVGAVSSVVNANTQPAGKMDPWRRQVDCLFGLALNGQPRSVNNPYDATGTYTCGSTAGTNWTAFDIVHPQVDRLPLEGIVGWDTTVNGNLAELLQEPSLMGAYEGAAITVLGKGIKLPTGLSPFDPTAFGVGAESAFPAGTTLLSASDCTTSRTNSSNPYPSNFYCNPSSIDGLSLTDSSQGGGGLFVHAWGHNLVIANNRVYGNTGTSSGGITLGQGEAPEAQLVGGDITPPGSCDTGTHPTNTQLPFCFNTRVDLHHNAVVLNSSIGDELFSSTPAGAGGVTLYAGADYYRFHYNWVCGNYSSGDGGGVGQIGFVYSDPTNPAIEHNTILFNQSANPTITTNGGGLIVMGAPPDASATSSAAECGSQTDVDCAPGLGDGTGPGLVINANLIMGNAAESGSGGGLRLQGINGTEVINFPTTPTAWYAPLVTNNIIVNNVAGWDGGGISLLDALNTNIVNNTIMSNDSTASAGVLFNTIGAPLASSTGPTCTANCGVQSPTQPAGLVSIQNSAQLVSALGTTTVTCPAGHYSTSATNGECRTYSFPLLYNNVFWQNRAFHIGVGPLGAGTLNQQNVVTLYDGFTANTPASQTFTGQCPSDPSVYYWDMGVRGDTGHIDHTGGRLAPIYSFLTFATDYPGLNNSGSNPAVASQYCNGARVPPENGGLGYQVPPGISDATVPNPIFSLTPSATVDEGNNWININWGPLTTINPTSNVTLGNYTPGSGTSPTVNYIPSTATTAYGLAPATDFFGNQRKNGFVDAGAVEFGAGATLAAATVTPSVLNFGNWATGTTSNPLTVLVTNTGNVALAGGTFTFSAGTPFTRVTTGTFPTGAPNCGAALAIGASCTIKVQFASTATGTVTRTLTVAYGGGAVVVGSPVTLTGTGVSTRATVAIAPNPLTITLPRGVLTGTGTVSLTNTAPATGSSIAVTNVVAAGGSLLTYLFTNGPLAGPNTCTGANLAPGQSCSVSVRFTNVLSARGVNRAGTVTFTDTAAGSPQVGSLIGFATP